MSLTTFSAFYYGHTVTKDNNAIPFKEGVGDELTAELNVGSYTLTDYAAEIKRALDATGDLTYTVAVNRTTRVLTISSTSTFSLLALTGTENANGAWQMMGFTQTSDKTGASTYTAGNASGSEYLPQFILQDHVSTAHWKGSIDSTVNKTADGTVEVVSFGDQAFLQCNITYVTNITQDGAVIKTNGTGVTDLVNFMTYLITKGPIEYMPSISDRNTFESLILESTPDNSDGVGFRLNELYGKGLPGYFETGILKFRVY
jgi:hypothetical protein